LWAMGMGFSDTCHANKILVLVHSCTLDYSTVDQLYAHQLIIEIAAHAQK